MLHRYRATGPSATTSDHLHFVSKPLFKAGCASTRAHNLVPLKAKIRATRYYIPDAIIRSYAELYARHGASHELTISLGTHPRSFDPETEFLPQMRRVARALTHDLRGLPKRKLETMQGKDSVFMAGFYEPTDGSGTLFPHWHGVIALKPDEEDLARSILLDRVGDDKTSFPPATGATTRSVISTARAKPSFHLKALETPEHYVSYATKKVRNCSPVHWHVGDFFGGM